MENYIGEIRAFASNRIPGGWIPCDGATLLIRNYQALYALMGTTYGGDGRVNFNIPDLRGATMASIGPTIPQGKRVGTETVTLAPTQLPIHTHSVMITTTVNGVPTEGSSNLVAGVSPAAKPGFPTVPGDNINPFVPSGAVGNSRVTMNKESVSTVGSTLPHNNMMPYLTVQLCICVNGIFPPRP